MRWMAGLIFVPVMALAIVVPGWSAQGEYPLTFQFSQVHVPATLGATAQTEGRVGGLSSILSLTAVAQPQCSGGGACGVFTISVVGLGASASGQFGQLRGTFACAGGECVLKFTGQNGVFSNVTAGGITVSSTSASSGTLSTTLANHGTWVSSVARAAAMLKAEGELPAGLSVGDLVGQAAQNEQELQQTSQQHSPGGSKDNGKSSGNGSGGGNGNGGGSGNSGGNGNSGGSGNGGGSGNSGSNGNGGGNGDGGGSGNSGGKGNNGGNRNGGGSGRGH